MNYKIINSDYKKELETKTLKEFILMNRGIKNPKQYLNLDDSVLNDPSLLENIYEAKECLFKHIENESRIGIVTDGDGDGYVSASIMYRYLAKIYDPNKLSYYIHSGKQHGIDDLLNEIINSEINLLIVPDAGSNDVNECKRLSNNNIDVIILDHHQIEKENPYAIVVNNQLGNYPNKYLSGGAVTKKFLELLDEETWEDSSEYNDLVAISIIADSMSTLELENRRLIEIGLSNIKSKFIQALIEKQSYSIGNSKININVIAFYISPLVNALIRSGSMEDKINMFKAFIEDESQEFEKKKRDGTLETENIYQYVARTATNLKAKQNREIDKEIEKLDEKILKNKWDENKILFCNADGVDYNFTGLISMRLASKYNKPCLLIRKNKNGIYAGSARNFGNQIENLKDYLENTGLFEYASGHQNAMGVGIKGENISKAVDLLNENLKDINFGEFIHYVDFVIDADELDAQIAVQMNELYDYYGNGINESLILVKNILVNSHDIELIGKNKDTWKFLYNDQMEFIKFKNDQNDFLLSSLNLEWGGFEVTIDAVCKISISEFGGITKPQAIVVDYEVKK